MLHPFISVAASGRIHPTIATMSAALHAALLYLAVAPTRSVAYTERPEATTEQVQFAILALGTAPLRMARALVASQLSDDRLRHSIPRAVLSEFHFAIPLVTSPAVDARNYGGKQDLSAVVLHSVAAPAEELVFPNITYEPEEVELQAVPLPANPKPQYPATMARRQVEAKFAVFFVVDTSGRIDRQSIELPLIPHEEFTNAVIDVLQKWTFEPAEVAGHRVRERVKQPFHFRLH
jgi:TonB family protein